VTPDNKL